MNGYSKPPAFPEWEIPEQEHTQQAPFCGIDSCRCHYEQARMERYFIQPIERGELSIAEAIDLYHCEPGYMARKQAETREVVLV